VIRALPPLLALAIIGCASGSAPPPKEPEPAAPAPGDDNPKGRIHGGSIAPVEVKKAIATRKAEIRACYHSLLEKDKNASGKVVIRFTIAEDGTVEETVILNETSLPRDTAQCIADVVAGITFAKPTGGKARITYPWEFTAE
jgi:hypothetical protein